MVKNLLWLIYLYTLFLFFNSVKSEIVTEEIIVNDTRVAIDSIEGNKYYHVTINMTSNQSLYIVVFGGPENVTNHIISIYKDSEFIDRKQMVQSLDDLSYVMLNEEQIGTDFYLSIECAKLPCTYALNIFYKNYLQLGEQDPYTYYVTEENKVMKFGLIGQTIKENLDEGDIVLVYARGSKYITTQLEGLSYTKHSEYNAYIITNLTKEPDEFGMLYFTVEAKVGDLINVGYLTFGNKQTNNTFSKVITNNGDEYIGFLKKGVIEQNCFSVEKEGKSEPVEINIVPYDKVLINNAYSEPNDKYYLYCINFTSFDNKYDQIDELFYSIQFIFDFKDDGQGINKYPQITPDTYYTRKFYKGDILVLDQLEPGDEYKYLSILALSSVGNIKLYLYKCTNFPLCKVDEKAIEDSILIHHFYNLYPYSITKDEIGENITVISKTQHYFLLTCEEGFQEDENSKEWCMASYVSYTNKDKIPIQGYAFVYEREGDENHFYPFLYNEFKPETDKEVFIDVKIFTGDVSVTINKENYKSYEYQSNKVYYILPENDLELTIKANINSIFSIEVFTDESSYPIKNAFNIGEGNYLFKFDNNDTMDLYPNFLFSIGEVPDYAAFYPLNCKISVERGIRNNNIPESDEYTPIKERNGFYQELIIHNEGENITQLGFKVKATDESFENCMFSASFYTLEQNVNENKRGIVLNYNDSLPFIFETNYTYAYFLYPFSPNNADFSLNFKIKKNEKYNMELLINNITINKNVEIDKSTQILIENKDWAEMCSDIKQICVLSFVINSQQEEESFIDIIISSTDYEMDEDEEEIPEEEEETIPDINPEEEETENIPEEEESEDIPEEEETENIPEEESEDNPEEESEDIPEEKEEEEKDDEEENYEEETDEKEEEEENEEEENEGKEEKEEEEEEEEGGKGPDNGDKKNTGLPTLYIVIIAISGFIVIVAIIFILLKCRNKNTKENIEILNIEKAFEKDLPLM